MSERTAAELRSLLLSGTFAPGDRLAEIPLARRLGVSRPTMREALGLLAARGLAVTEGRGLLVADAEPAVLRSLLLTRAGLEGLHAELLALRVREGGIAPAQLRWLTERRQAFTGAERAGQRRLTQLEDRAMHQAIDGLAGNPVGAELLDGVWDRLMIATGREGPDRGFRRAAHDAEHRAILDAIGHGRPRRARAAATEHVLATIAAREL